jgi:hypothetical protein
MTRVDLQIAGVFRGPASIATSSIVALLREHAGLELVEARDLVDRALFGGERVAIPAPSREAAERLVAALAQSPEGPSIRAVVSRDA